jgi:hypothetical protein
VVIRAGASDGVAQLFPDPLAALRQAHERLEEMRTHEVPPHMAEKRPKMLEAIEASTRNEVALIVASLLAGKRDQEAGVLLGEARRRLPGQQMEQALRDMAKKAGVALPS